MINISLNGETKTLQDSNLLSAMREWQYPLELSAVAINGEFVPRSDYAHVELTNGDQIDVVGAVGGG